MMNQDNDSDSDREGNQGAAQDAGPPPNIGQAYQQRMNNLMEQMLGQRRPQMNLQTMDVGEFGPGYDPNRYKNTKEWCKSMCTW